MTSDTDPDAGRPSRRRRTSRSPRERYPAIAGTANRILVALLILVLLWAPIPLGSNRPVYLSLLSTAIGVALLGWGGLYAFGLAKGSSKLMAVTPAACLFALAMFVGSLQVVELKGLDQLLGTQFAHDIGHPMWHLAGESLGQGVSSYVTVNPARADAAFAKSFLYAGVFFLAFILARRTSIARLLLTSVAVSAAFCVMVGFFIGASGTNLGLAVTGEILADQPRFSATFVNPNHLSTYACIGMLAALGLTHDTLSQGIVSNRGRDIFVRTTMSTVIGPALPGLASMLLLSGAVLTSSSRAGTLAMLAGCVTLVAILYVTGRGSSSKAGSGVANTILVVILLFGLAAASAPLFSRVNSGGFQDTVRSQIYQTTVEAITASPVLGNGFGAFEQYYPLYAHDAMPGTINAAHNDYLEAMSDLGLIGGLALILAPAYLALLAAQGAFRRRKGRIFGAVAFSAATLCAVHAFFEFSLQIPAVGVLLYTVLGVGVAQSWRGEDDEAGDPRMSA